MKQQEQEQQPPSPPREVHASEPPEVAELLAMVEQAIEAKKAEGFYDPEEMRRVEEAAITFSQVSSDASSAELGLLQASLEKTWDLTRYEVEIPSSGGLPRRILGAVRKAFYRFMRPAFAVSRDSQTKFNDEVQKLTSLMIHKHLDIRERVPNLERRADLLEDTVRELRSTLIPNIAQALKDSLLQAQDEYKGIYREIDVRLASAEREIKRDDSRMETILARMEKLVQTQAAAGQVDPGMAREASRLRAQSRGAGYLAFEDLHRGAREDIMDRQSVYLPYFKGCSSPDRLLLDIGCGRGEFVESAVKLGLSARGLDSNPEMAAFCRDLGLDVVEADGAEYLESLPDESLGGIMMSQVIEHLTEDQLQEIIALAFRKLAPGGVLVAETINPQCLTTFCGAFYLDITHQKPIHPEASRFLLRWAGFGEVEVVYVSPYPPGVGLEALPEGGDMVKDAFNRNVDRLNQLLYSYQDYAVVGRK